MGNEIITSRENENIKQYVRLLSSAKHRKSERLFVLEGMRLCLDGLESGFPLEKLFFTAEAYRKYGGEIERLRECSGAAYEISDAFAGKLSDTKTPQGIFCISKILDKTSRLDKIENRHGKYLALQNIQDPSNLGAVSRAAEAMGLSGLIVSGGCDRYNPKALRASMGSLLRIPLWEPDDLAASLSELKDAGLAVYASVPDASSLPLSAISSRGGLVVAVGNEGNGLTPDVISVCNGTVTIPMKGRAQSLNAAVAAGIICYQMML